MQVYVLSKDAIADVAGELIDRGGVIGVFATREAAIEASVKVFGSLTIADHDSTIERMTIGEIANWH